MILDGCQSGPGLLRLLPRLRRSLGQFEQADGRRPARPWLLAVAAGLLAATARADVGPTLDRQDFAYAMELKVGGQSPAGSLLLPAEVHQGCTRADLGDLRVFNADGPVPHLIRRQKPERQPALPAQSLPFFPLPEQANGNAQLGIAIGSGGAIVVLGPGSAAPSNIGAYVVDASGLRQPPEWLELSWSGQGEQFSSAVRVDGSDDLDRWQPLVDSSALADLRFDGRRLLRNRIGLEADAVGKYLRISWPAGRNGVVLTAVMAGSEEAVQARPRRLLVLDGQPDPRAEAGKTGWLYDTKGFFPVDQVAVRMAEQNSLAELAVFSRADEKAPWQRRTSMLAWRMAVDGVSLDSGTHRLAPTTDRFWRLETEEASLGGRPPRLALGWLQSQLVFMTQGRGPYALLYGRAGLPAVRSRMEQLLSALEPVGGSSLVEAIQAGPQMVMAGDSARQPTRTVPWRVVLLWAGLVAGVLMVGAMAMKLYREMSSQPPDLPQ